MENQILVIQRQMPWSFLLGRDLAYFQIWGVLDNAAVEKAIRNHANGKIFIFKIKENFLVFNLEAISTQHRSKRYRISHVM